LLITLSVALIVSGSSILPAAIALTPVLPLDPTTIPKYKNQLVIPPVYLSTLSFNWKTGKIVQQYKVDMSQFYEQILPLGYPQTLVWGYGCLVKDAVTGKFLRYVRNSPGPSFVAYKGIPVQVTWD
jgi:hypothetical protein